MLRKSRLRIFLLALALFGLVAFPAAQAATFVIVNNDGAGEGFNDPTAAAPVGGNSGTTIGQQRLIAFQAAADIWGALLSSAVTIRVQAQFNPLTCTAGSAVLGSAGPTLIFRDFSGAPIASTWYAVALANARHGSDLDAGNDINATFSSTIGTPGCLETSGWYYGLDANAPANRIDFVSVLLHELGHGLGFLTFVNLTTGALNSGFNDAFMLNLENHGASPADYPSMSNAQRVAASIATGNLHWTGANVRAASGVLSAGKVGDHVQMFAPNPAQSGSSVSHWNTALTPNQVMEPSYTGPLHNPVLELPLFQDIGWILTPQSFLLSVSTTGSGTVTSSPAGINCGATCSANYSSGTPVTLTPTPASGWSFTSWSGACSGSGSCIVTMNSAQSVSATFTQLSFALSVSKTGSGTLTSSPAGISCGATCSANFLSGTPVTLTPTPASGWSFISWGGACSGAGGCIVTMNSAQSVSATFQAITATGLTAAPNPSIFGQAVTFTATVTSGGGTPTGSVTFKDGAATLGTGTLSGGVASFITSTLSVGSHSITANYGGTGTFIASVSSALTQVVNIVGSSQTTYVLAKTGTNSGACPITAPCATLNYALSVTGVLGRVVVIGGGVFGPVLLTNEVSIAGYDPLQQFQIAADPTASVGCVMAAPGSCGANNGYGVEIAAGASDTITLTNAIVTAGINGAGALKFGSGGKLQLSDNVYRGNDTQTGPIVVLYPNNPGTTQAQVYFSNSDIGFNNSGANAGAVEVKPSGTTSLKLHFNHVEVHNASYGIRTDSSLLASPTVSVATAISESEMFSFANAAVNAFSAAGTGTTTATFDAVRILNANIAIKANGPLSTVILTNSTISGNGTGVQVQNGAHVYTPQNNTIYGNAADLSGALSSAPPR